MGAVMDFFLRAIRDNNEIRKYFFLFLVIVVIVISIPFIDANFFYYDRTIRRVQLINELLQNAPKSQNTDPELYGVYITKIQEIESYNGNSIHTWLREYYELIYSTTIEEYVRKFSVGGSVFWIIAIICIIMPKTGFIDKVQLFMRFSLWGILYGLLVGMIPFIAQPKVHYLSAIFMSFVTIFLILICDIEKIINILEEDE